MTLTSETLGVHELPHYDTSNNPTGCCPRFTPDGWDDRELHFKDQLFVEATTRSVMHIPLNMGSVFRKTIEAIEAAKAHEVSQFIVLSRDLSPWKAEHRFAVTKYVPGTKMKHLTGNYRTKVFEGPFSDARKWCEELKKTGSPNGHGQNDRFFLYITCPSCAKHYGRNHVVGPAAV